MILGKCQINVVVSDMATYFAAVQLPIEIITISLSDISWVRSHNCKITFSKLSKLIQHAHGCLKKFHLEIPTDINIAICGGKKKWLKKCCAAGLDAVVINELGHIRYFQKNFPTVELLGGDNFKVYNAVSLTFFRRLGLKGAVIQQESLLQTIFQLGERIHFQYEINVKDSFWMNRSDFMQWMNYPIRIRTAMESCFLAWMKSLGYDYSSWMGYCFSSYRELGMKKAKILKNSGIHQIDLSCFKSSETNVIIPQISYNHSIFLMRLKDFSQLDNLANLHPDKIIIPLSKKNLEIWEQYLFKRYPIQAMIWSLPEISHKEQWSQTEHVLEYLKQKGFQSWELTQIEQRDFFSKMHDFIFAHPHLLGKDILSLEVLHDYAIDWVLIPCSEIDRYYSLPQKENYPRMIFELPQDIGNIQYKKCFNQSSYMDFSQIA